MLGSFEGPPDVRNVTPSSEDVYCHGSRTGVVRRVHSLESSRHVKLGFEALPSRPSNWIKLGIGPCDAVESGPTGISTMDVVPKLPYPTRTGQGTRVLSSSKSVTKMCKDVQTDFHCPLSSKGQRCHRHSSHRGHEGMANDSSTRRTIDDVAKIVGTSDGERPRGIVNAGTRDRVPQSGPKRTLSESTRSLRHMRKPTLPIVNFSRWTRITKKPCQLSQLVDRYFASVYQPFSRVRKQLERQARDVLLCRCHGDYQRFEEHFLKPVAGLLSKLQQGENGSPKRKKKLPGWPLCSGNYIIVHLTSLDDHVLKPGDFYVFVSDDWNSLTLRYRDLEGVVGNRTFHDSSFAAFMAGLLDPQPSRGDEDQLASLLAHLMVSVERGIERIEMNHLAQIIWKCDGDHQICRRRNRNRTVATRDSWVQTTFNENEDYKTTSVSTDSTDGQSTSILQPLAPLASEEEFLSDTESKLKRNGDGGVDENSNPPQGSCERCPIDIPEVIMFSDLPSVTELDQNVLKSQVAVSPGSQDICGRSVVFLSLNQLRVHDCITAIQLAQLLLCFRDSPSKKEAVSQGFLMIINGKETTEREWLLLQEALCIVKANSPNSYHSALVWPKSNTPSHPSSLLHAVSFQCEVISNENELLSYIKKSQLLPEFGGSYEYDHKEWIEFHQLLDPFISGCRKTGSYLVRVMQELREYHLNSSTSLTNQMIEKQKQQIMEALENEQLRSLDENGDTVLYKLNSYCEKSSHNLGYKEAVEKSTLLYKQLKKVLQRLNKLADKRLSKLQECMLLKTFEEESNQILSWLSMKGEETLKKHKSLPDNFNAIKQQENEFEKFYFLAMRHIERGNDLLEEIPKPKDVLSSGMDGMTSLLRNHLGDFSERLETAREKLEDTSRCYQLLDKCYEWALETMRFVSLMKIDSTTSLDSVTKITANLQHYLDCHPYISDHIFEEMVELAGKLSNDRLLQQCQTAERKCKETMELVHARQATLEKAKDQMEDDGLLVRNDSPGNGKSRSHVWMPVISSTPYRTPSQNYLHGHGPQFGSQYVFREPTGSYTSFPSSYYPATDLKDHRLIEHFSFRKGELNISSEHLAKDFVDQRPVASLLSSLIDPVKSRVDGRRKSYISSSSSSMRSSATSNSSHEILHELCSVSRGVPSGSVSNEVNFRNRSNGGQKWQNFKDALEKATKEVREQNNKLFQERVNERESDPDDAVRNTSSSFSDSPRLSTDKPLRPLLANAHLLRCTSCSDFEELLSPKNSEAEVAKAKTKKKLKMIMREMIQTERDYVKSLEYIIENYIPVLQKADIPQVLRGQRNVIFGNIEKIYEFHNCYFLQELEQCETMPYSVGQCFLKYEPQFYLYALYNKNKPKSEALMAEYGNNFFRSKQHELGDKMDLASYLLKPVQRMGKYALLVKQLLKECPERDNDYNELKAAEEMIHFQLRHGNDLLAMDALRDCDVNVKEQGRLLRQDEFLVWQGKSRKALRHVFLFEDLILFSKARRDPERKGHDYYQYKHSIKTSDIGLTEQAGESPTKFEIWFRKWKVQDVHTLQAPSTDTKKAWVQDISKLLWNQALRNRELRMAEMSSMGIGNKPCLDISPSQNQICDRSISLQQLNKAPRFRNSIAVINYEGSLNKRPHSIISVSSSSSSGSNQSSGAFQSPLDHLLEADENEISRCQSMTQQSQCSAESGFFTDVSMSGDSYAESEYQRLNSVERSDSILSQASVASSVGAVCSDGPEIKQGNEAIIALPS